jgi:hypothetical protein
VKSRCGLWERRGLLDRGIIMRAACMSSFQGPVEQTGLAMSPALLDRT